MHCFQRSLIPVSLVRACTHTHTRARIYLKDLVTERGRERKESSIDCFTLEMAAMAKARPDHSQEPGTISGCPIGMAGAQAVEGIFHNFPTHIGKELHVKQSILDSNRHPYVGIEGGVRHCATTLPLCSIS